ncbi:hypothetical protein TKK_0003372 [Trichogramma kaykai]
MIDLDFTTEHVAETNDAPTLEESSKRYEDVNSFTNLQRLNEVAKKGVTYATYFNLAESEKLWRLPTGPLFEACDRHLCEEVVKRFYRRVRDEFPELEDLVRDALTPRAIKPFWE